MTNPARPGVTGEPTLTGHLRALAEKPRGNRPHVLRNLSAVLVLILAAVVVFQLITNPAFGWDVVLQYMFDPYILKGLVTTLELTAISMVIALVVAVVVANMRMSTNPVLRSISGVYVWFFRSIPTLVLIILWFNLAILYPRITIGVPGSTPLLDVATQDVVNPFWAGAFAFGLQQAAYTSEVLRAALSAVPKGQREAAHALGMSSTRTFFTIVSPQALRIAIPPITNETINLLKGTTLVAFISVSDLLYSAQQIYNRNYEIIPLLMVAAIWYMMLVTVLTIVQQFVEVRLRRRTRSGLGRKDVADLVTADVPEASALSKEKNR